MTREARRLVASAVSALALAGVVALYLAWTRGETSLTRYESFAAAERDGAVRRGWVPEYLPRSATQLEESHNLDTNAQLLRFRAPAQDLRAMAVQLEASSAALVSPPGRARQDSAIQYYIDRNIREPRLTVWRALCYELDFRHGTAEMWSCMAR